VDPTAFVQQTGDELRDWLENRQWLFVRVIIDRCVGAPHERIGVDQREGERCVELRE
jgi:hypothetical protein